MLWRSQPSTFVQSFAVVAMGGFSFKVPQQMLLVEGFGQLKW
jgi:hypothetical protein